MPPGTRSAPLYLLVFLIFLPSATATAQEAISPLEAPKIVVTDIPFDFELLRPPVSPAGFSIQISRDGRPVYSKSGQVTSTLTDVRLPAAGTYDVVVMDGESRWEFTIRAVPGWLTILPPIIAIVMALIFRQVIIALFAGVWLGAFIVNDYNPVRGFFYVIDHYTIDSLAGNSGADHVAISIFTLMLGGMVGVFSRIGGTGGIVDQISKIATTARRGQLATWLMGICIFFDDYTNTLIVGNTMRPITDRLRISREKLAYIVDSTAAPVAVIAIITSWVGFEISLIKDAFDAAGIDRNPFTTFVASIQYSFYPILTLVFGLLIASTTRDFGPMLRAEKRARTKRQVLSEKAMPLSSLDADIALASDAPRRWYNAVIPIAVVVLGAFVGLVITGRTSLVESGVATFSLMDTIRESNAFDALLWSSLVGCVVAIGLGLGQRLASLADIMTAWGAGVKSMVPAFVILILAWSIGAVCTDLHTADYLITQVSGLLNPQLLPMIIFLIAAAVSFSTGTSWGTMTILTPIAIPLVVKVSALHGLADGGAEAVLLSGIAAIMAGSVFGDHCSPISDTTIMSSMASGSDHIDHVRTQLPYALVVAAVAIVLGYLPVGFNVPSIVALLASGGALFAIIRFLGKTEASYTRDGAASD